MKMMRLMNYTKAIDVVEDLENYTDGEIAHAIYKILSMKTIMAVKKDTLLKCVRHLFYKCYTVEEEGAVNNEKLSQE